MKFFSLKECEGKKVTIILNNGNRYSNIIYKVGSDGYTRFIDNKYGTECHIRNDFIAVIEVKENGN